MRSSPAIRAALARAADEPWRTVSYGFLTRSAVGWVGSPVRTWPWWGSAKPAEPGPAHQASRVPERN
eukprot:15448344-Alexandrium_andersonii.AAC.1